MQYIYKQRSKEMTNGYKVHYNLSGETFYKNFSVADFGSAEKALNAAKQFRDETVFQQREQLISEMIKKTRDIEFERGLRDKIQAEEIEEIRIILKKYGVI